MKRDNLKAIAEAQARLIARQQKQIGKLTRQVGDLEDDLQPDPEAQRVARLNVLLADSSKLASGGYRTVQPTSSGWDRHRKLRCFYCRYVMQSPADEAEHMAAEHPQEVTANASA